MPDDSDFYLTDQNEEERDIIEVRGEQFLANVQLSSIYQTVGMHTILYDTRDIINGENEDLDNNTSTRMDLEEGSFQSNDDAIFQVSEVFNNTDNDTQPSTVESETETESEAESERQELTNLELFPKKPIRKCKVISSKKPNAKPKPKKSLPKAKKSSLKAKKAQFTSKLSNSKGKATPTIILNQIRIVCCWMFTRQKIPELESSIQILFKSQEHRDIILSFIPKSEERLEANSSLKAFRQIIMEPMENPHRKD